MGVLALHKRALPAPDPGHTLISQQIAQQMAQQMAHLKHKITGSPPPPERGVKAATFHLLLDTAMSLIQHDGHIPSVAEVAVRSKVSRATAYRYFPTRSALITAVIEASLGPVRTVASDQAGGRERVRELFIRTFPRFAEFEPQLRAAAQLSLEQGALERAGLLEEEPYRRGHRIRILEHALEPLAPQLPPTLLHRLHRALSVVYGIEPYIILKDIWGLPNRAVEGIALWMADALIDAALREAVTSQTAPAKAPFQLASPAVTHAAPAAELDVLNTPGAGQPLRKPTWYDAQYNARAAIADHPAILQSWYDRSLLARQAVPAVLDVPYGPAASETLDIFHPPLQAGSSDLAPVLVYLHGGYWRALDKRDQSFVAPPFVQAGAVVVVPNYALVPAVGIADIVLQLVQACVWVYQNIHRYGGDARRIVVAGHSAGGHLAAMLLACLWQQVPASTTLPPDLVRHALCVSGLFDLEPLRHAPFLADDLKLSAAEARRLSPACMPAPGAGRLMAVVGALESEEFRRQSLLIAERWGRERVTVCEALPDRHHMNVLHDLAEPGTRLNRLALELLALG